MLLAMSKLREQIREARLVRVLLVYLGASWAVLEATALMRDELGLPPWVIPLAAILLVVGLVIITTSATLAGLVLTVIYVVIAAIFGWSQPWTWWAS